MKTHLRTITGVVFILLPGLMLVIFWGPLDSQFKDIVSEKDYLILKISLFLLISGIALALPNIFKTIQKRYLSRKT